MKLIAKGQQLDLTATLDDAGLRDGDMVTAVVQLGQLAATSEAFALHGHGEVVTWGRADCGADSSQVQEQLRNVQHIQSIWGCCHMGYFRLGRIQQPDAGAAFRLLALKSRSSTF